MDYNKNIQKVFAEIESMTKANLNKQSDRGMKIIATKTKVTVLKTDDEIIECNIRIEDEKVEQVNEFVYLRSQSDSFESLLKSKISPSKDEKTSDADNNFSRPLQWQYVEKLIKTIAELSVLIKSDNSILISVKNQKLLRCCFEFITSMGLLPCLIPGMGINLYKRSENACKIPQMQLDDTEKYTLLKQCTDFFTQCYDIPVLKNIILTVYLADYLAALIQLSYAPIKKPGTYEGFTMTQEMYGQLLADRSRYVLIFKNLVATCFQPIIMKELLVLQSGTDPSPPLFLKRVTSRELSNRLLAPGGLLSLIRCFIESQSVDVGYDWKKIDMVRRIVSTKHRSLPDEVYIGNMCRQLRDIISSSNVQYYSTAAACILHLREKYPSNTELEVLSDEILKCFDLEYLEQKSSLPGTVILTFQEIDHKINILHSLFFSNQLNESPALLSSNLYTLILIRLKCLTLKEFLEKLDNLISKGLNEININNDAREIRQLLFGDIHKVNAKIAIEEYDSGIVLKRASENMVHPVQEVSRYFTELIRKTSNTKIAGNVFDVCLDMLASLTNQRRLRANKSLLELEDGPGSIDQLDATYAVTLQMLEELASIPKVLSYITKNPECIIKFIENILLKSKPDDADECVTIALVLLNTILSESDETEQLKRRCLGMVPTLRQLRSIESDNGFLANEIFVRITDVNTSKINKKSEFELVILSIFDNSLPVRAHGLMELTKLIEKKDPETLSKKHYVMCLFQEHLKDEDSYVYLSAINGIAALGRHCPEDVLNMLCKEFLEPSTSSADVETAEISEKRARLRMKVGEVIVKVTRSLGEMGVVHKALLLNTVLCACRDEDALVRSSSLSNLAELALVLHYRLGTVLYEILLCVCSVLDSDKSPECRRAAVMVISSLLRGLGDEMLLQLKDTLLPVYRTLKKLYHDPDEDAVVRLHAQIALEELNDVVRDFILPKLDTERKIITDVEKPGIKFK